MGGTLVLRHRQWAVQRERDRYVVQHHMNSWRGNGRLDIVAKRTSQGMLTLDVFASEVPAWRFAEVFSQKTGWTVKVEDSIRDVRLFAHWRDASPAQMLEALTVLLNSRQDVTISRSEAQKRKEEKQLEEAFDQRTWEEKASESLLPELDNY